MKEIKHFNLAITLAIISGILLLLSYVFVDTYTVTIIPLVVRIIEIIVLFLSLAYIFRRHDSKLRNYIIAYGGGFALFLSLRFADYILNSASTEVAFLATFIFVPLIPLSLLSIAYGGTMLLVYRFRKFSKK